MIDLSAYRRLLLTAYLLTLLGATLAPVPGGAYPPTGFDKLVHVVLFGGLAVLLRWALKAGSAGVGALLPLALTLGIAGSIELLQGVLPFRDADEWDFIAGAVGALLGIACASALEALSRRRAPSDGPGD